jgi:PmbA protein
MSRIAKRFLNKGLELGCSAVRVTYEVVEGWYVRVRNGVTEEIGQSYSRGMEIEVYVDGKYGSYRTSEVEGEGVEAFVENAVSSARAGEEDGWRMLPKRRRYYRGGGSDLALNDAGWEQVTVADCRSVSTEICKEVKKRKGLESVEVEMSGSRYWRFLSDSAKFCGYEGPNTEYGISVTSTVRDGERKASWTEVRRSADYVGLEKYGLGLLSSVHAEGRKGAIRGESGRYKVVVSGEALSQLVSPLLSGLYGSALYNNNSFLKGKKDEKLFGTLLTLSDEPHRKGESRSRYFDEEGVSTSRQVYIEKGIVRTYMLDTYYGHLLKNMPTLSSPSTVVAEVGKGDMWELLREACGNDGVLITRFLGGNCNIGTGAYSYGIEGHRVRGEKTEAWGEMNMTGNMVELWKNLIGVGADVYSGSWSRLPSMAFADVSLSGV